MKVREAQVADERGIAAVLESAIGTLRETYRPTPAAIRRKAARAPALTRLVALDGDELVGTVEYELEDYRVHVLGLGVLELHRRRGVARCLVDALTTIGAAAGARALSLVTIAETGNCVVFERLGFVVTTRQPTADYVSDSVAQLTELYMQRALPGAPGPA